MIKVGFIDYYLNEWHADHYPEWLKAASNGEIEVAYCYGQIDGYMSNADWAKEHGCELCSSIEEVIEKSDVLCVLSPDNPEKHRELCELALRSGKITYVDKTFAPDLETAKYLIDLAESNGTPMITTSALRYATEYENINKDGLYSAFSIGGGPVANYIIHQLEPVVKIFGTDALRVKNAGTELHPVFVIEFANGARTTLSCAKPGLPFIMNLNYENESKFISVGTDPFEQLIENLVKFFRTGELLVPHAETLAIAAIREACLSVQSTPDVWADVKKA